MSKALEQAKVFKAAVEKEGWYIARAQDGIVTISKNIGRDDRDGFVRADSEYYGILSLAPLKGGSIWGTDGGGIGALSAMRSGVFTMNKSGNGSRFINALKKIM